LIERAARKSPAAFRNHLKWSTAPAPKAGLNSSQHQLTAWQERDFSALDNLWSALANRTSGGLKRAYLERPRGHSKTTDLAVMVTWILQYCPRQLMGVVAAADKDQACLLKEAIERIVRLNPDLCSNLECFKEHILNKKTGSKLIVISSDVKSSWGILPDFVICDELCHWAKPELWYSLLSSAMKKPECVLVVLSNAGVGKSWHWQAREAARTGEQWYFSTIDGTQAPWITQADINEQKRLLPPSVFNRLWLNQWQDSEGEFVSLKEAEACSDELLTPASQGIPAVHYVAAIDFASTRDNTVGVVAHLDPDGTIIVDRMDVEAPLPDQPVPVKWVKSWMLEMARKFSNISFVVDEFQLLSVIQDLGDCLDVEKFSFAGLKGHHRLAITLLRRIREQQVRWFKHCGQLASCEERNDLETELSSVLLKQFPNGMVRIDHKQDGLHHDDRVFALGMACLKLEEGKATHQWLTMHEPDFTGNINWEML
jgi:hypothetical protein